MPVMHFQNVANDGTTTIDALVTAVVQANTGFVAPYSSTGNPSGARGYVPDYKSTTTIEPNGDLGFLYDGIGVGNVSGVSSWGAVPASTALIPTPDTGLHR